MKLTEHPHFLLIGHEGSHNRGCEALARTTISILREEYPRSLITIASMYPESDYPFLEIEGVEIIPGVCQLPVLHDDFNSVLSPAETKQRRRSIRSLVKTVLPYGIVVGAYQRQVEQRKRKQASTRPSSDHEFSQVRSLQSAMLSADAIIYIGGDTLIEDYGPVHKYYYQELLDYARFLKRKTIVWGASIWPFRNKELEKRLQQALNATELITVRDQTTFDYLLNIGVISRIESVADGAFLMPPETVEGAQFEWKNEPQHVIGFNCTTVHMTNYPNVIPLLAQFIQQIIDTQNCGVILVPHDRKERDIEFEVQLAVNRPGSIFLAPLGLNAPQTKGIIGQCDMFIGMRFHPTIASLSQGIPTMGLSYSPKFAGLHQQVYGHTDYVLPYENVSVEQLLEKFQQLCENQESIRQQLAKRIPELQQMARRNGALVKEILG